MIKRVIPYVPPEDRCKLQEGIGKKFATPIHWNWLIFITGICLGSVIMMIVLLMVLSI